MPAPVRPIFKNGQRLTAERLTEALEFLRDWIRRFSLGPMSAGVGSGLELSPPNGSTGDIVVGPGVAVDGRGRLLVLELEQRFTRAEIEARVGLLNAGDVVRILLTLDEAASDPINPCNSSTPLRVVENVTFVFVRDGFLDNANDPGPLLTASRSCVNPWDNLDTSTGAGCGVTLGHVIIDSSNQVTASRRFRQGVSPRVATLFDSSGVPAITTGEMKVDFGTGSFVSNAVAVVQPTFFTQNVRFVGTTTANASSAQFAQATVLAPVTMPYFTAGLWDQDQRVFALMGGSNDAAVPAFLGGVSAVSCGLDLAGGDVTVPGEPLFLTDVTQTVTPKVSRTGALDKLIGISAARSAFLGGNTVVPVATAGLVKVTVTHSTALTFGSMLTAVSGTPGLLTPTSLGSGNLVIARAAQGVPSPGSASSIFAWVVHPAFPA